MVQFNFTERTIKAKVVYYGPAQSGKTTNLEQIHRLTDPAANNRPISLNTAQDRTLFFDLLPFSLGAVSGYDFKLQLYTVPGHGQEACAEVRKSAAAAGPAARSSPAPRAAKVVVSHATDSLHAAPPQTGSETGLVSEELLHRSLRSSVELAESLSGMVREMNLGLTAILSQAELLMVQREDARDKRQAAILAIQQEATRLKKVVAEL